MMFCCCIKKDYVVDPTIDCSRHSNTLHRPLTREEICKEKNVIEALNKSCLPFDDEVNQEKYTKL